VDADSVELMVTMPQEAGLSFQGASGWNEVSAALWFVDSPFFEPSNTSIHETKSICFRDPLSILAHDAEISPGIKISFVPGPGLGGWYLTSIFIKSKGMNGSFTAFKMAFGVFPANVPEKPFFTRIEVTPDGNERVLPFPK
jgi:hypothetical protein